jgi:TonB-dependent receptor
MRYTNTAKERNYGEEKIQGPTRGSTAWLNVRTLADSKLMKASDIVGGGAYSVRDISWAQIPNDYARATFRPAGFVSPFAPDGYYKVQEEIYSFYGMANFDFHVAGVPVSVNAGGRYIDTTVTSAGYHQIQTSNGGTGYTSAPVSSEGSYKEFLPSFNAHADIWDGLVLRAAASQTLMRPALTDLAYKRTASWNSFRFTDGNPGLKPTYADQWEVGLEKYFDNGALVSGSYFFKRIAGVVRSALTGTVKNVTKYNANGSVDGVYDFDVYQPVNADGSYDVNGFEIAAVVPFGMFHPWLEGFGINANYTLLDSSLTGQSIINIPTPPVGLAKNTFNLTLYYENGPFEARASYNYKDRYVENIGYEMYPIYRSAYGQLDVSASYRIDEHFQIELKGINMSDTPTKGYTIDPSYPTMYEFSGRRISLGLRAEL